MVARLSKLINNATTAYSSPNPDASIMPPIDFAGLNQTVTVATTWLDTLEPPIMLFRYGTNVNREPSMYARLHFNTIFCLWSSWQRERIRDKNEGFEMFAPSSSSSTSVSDESEEMVLYCLFALFGNNAVLSSLQIPN